MNRNRKRLFTTVGLLVCIVPALLTTGWAETKEANENAALVNKRPITQRDYEREVTLFKERLQKEGAHLAPQNETRLRSAVLNEMINRELLFQESQKEGIQVAEDQAINQLTAIRKSYPDSEKFQAMLKRVNLSEADLMHHIRQRLAVKALIVQKIENKVHVDESEMKALYDQNRERFQQPEQVHASHILIKADEGADEAQIAAARKTLSELKSRAEKGEDFAALAKAHSQGPSGPRGGDLGTFGRGKMVKAFEEVAFKLEPGQVSNIVQTQFGFHLIKVHQKISPRTLGYDEIKPGLAQQMRAQKRQAEMQAYLKVLRQNAEIETFIE